MPATVKVGLSSSSIAADKGEVVGDERAEASADVCRTNSQCLFSAGANFIGSSIASRKPGFSSFTVYLPARTAKNAKAPSALVLVVARVEPLSSARSMETPATEIGRASCRERG